MGSEKTNIDPRIIEQAAAWFEASDDTSAAHARAFGAWLAAHPDHARAYQRVEEQMSSAALDEALRAYAVPRASARPTAAPRRGHRYLRMAVAAGLVLPVTLLVAWLVRHGAAPTHRAAPAPQSVATAIGETRALQIADGSRLHLSAQTRVAYNLAGAQRAVELQQGEVFFEVATDADRPFIVTAGTTTVTVLGTVFDVNRVGDRVRVQVYEGHVRVSNGTQSNLHAGDSLWSGSGSLGPVAAFDRGADRPDWMRGWLRVQEMPLGDVLAQLQRYAPYPIVLHDARLGTLRVSGQLSLERPRESMALLAELQGLNFAEQDGRWVLDRSR